MRTFLRNLIINFGAFGIFATGMGLSVWVMLSFVDFITNLAVERNTTGLILISVLILFLLSFVVTMSNHKVWESKDGTK